MAHGTTAGGPGEATASSAGRPRGIFALRWQVALVLLLFAGSLATLLVTQFAFFRLPQREASAREQVRDASRRMAEEAAEALRQFPLVEGRKVPGKLHSELSVITRRLLSDAPGVEGGFYLGNGFDQFTGYAFPTRPGPEPPRPEGHKGRPKKGGPPPPEPPDRREPPPLEEPFIRVQAQQSLDLEPGTGARVDLRQVETSLVVVATEPVGERRPALLATWVMVRLTGPEQEQDRARRYQVSTGLALGGVLLGLVLAANLGRSLRHERLQRDRLQEELRRAEHLASLGRLLAGVAHEVRNPLAGIRSTLQLWQRLPNQARPPASMDALLGAVDRLETLVSRLLYFARSGYDKRKPVDLNALVRDTVALLGARAEAQGVSWELDLEPDLPAVPGSPQALHQVVLNLATNALQAMPAGGRCRFRTAARSGGRGVELRIGDTGPGVPDTARAHLFEPFFTTRPEGTGLGLALCREIVLQHGGDIALEPGPGAIFRVTLPAEAGASGGRPPPVEASGGRPPPVEASGGRPPPVEASGGRPPPVEASGGRPPPVGNNRIEGQGVDTPRSPGKEGGDRP
jgi:two-component system sensor histidine kinase HydH